MLCSDKMPSLALSKLRSTGSAVLSSLPQRSTGFGKIVSYGGNAAHSRSTSAGSSLSDGRSVHEHPRSRRPSATLAYSEKLPMQDSLFSIDMFGPPKQESPQPSAKTTLLDSNTGFSSRTLSLDEYHEERESIRTLKEYYEDLTTQPCPTGSIGLLTTQPCPMLSIGLPPGLEDLVEPKNAAAMPILSTPAPASCRNVELEEASDNTQPDFFYGAFDFEAPQFWTSELQEALDGSGQLFTNCRPRIVGEQPFIASEKPLNVHAPTFSPGEQTLNVNAPTFSPGKQTLNVSAPTFSPGEQTFACGGRQFNVDAEPFDMHVQAITVNAQSFDNCWQHEGVESFDVNEGVESFDVNEQSFQMSDLSFDANAETFDADSFDATAQEFDADSFDTTAQAFDADMPWFQPQDAWDALASHPADAYSGARAWIS